jgi:hypothetical protein
MNHDDIDQVLAIAEKIAPSPGFLASVMEEVEREAAAPAPLEFPWIRVLPQFLATIVAIAAAIWHAIGVLSDPAIIAALNEQILQLSTLAAGMGLQWIVLAVAMTVISITISSSLVAGITRSAR